MTVLVVCSDRHNYTIDNVVSINKILDTVIIQYIDSSNCPQSVTYDEECNVQLSALVM